MNNNYNISYKIIHIDKNDGNITIHPWSDSFTQPASSYPYVNINISNLDPTQDLSVQIARLCDGHIKSTIFRESSAFDALYELATTSLDQTVTIPVTATHSALPVADINFVA